MKKQSEVVAELTDHELKLNVYGTQGIMIILAGVFGFFVFDRWEEFTALFQFNINVILLLGGTVAIFIVLIDLVLEKMLPPSWLDDGGINERVFRELSLLELTVLCFVVAVAEELLFRAVLQTAFGLVIASTIFAVIHFRYLHKPILFINVWLVSFLLGALFYWTGNVLVTIFAHFMIDFLLGLVIRHRYVTKNSGRESNMYD
ncbi:CPBP family intramembrane metalloprotease [Alkalihalobacillus sp. MEB130]|uniref:CPBP family intramembrane glutamic endopeptidase n=1 Tax=Alkalihalobacillus sp. MEB130 TaxID=2976704 RepID=UPI0028E00B5F|nr:CPBP family intramembrane glutamic endopeptidase [Alkalihalobacillus sp. MEB130]MDT8860052.1 CPBP family intramembrane metalloprotease [Alkalihalobacillus sp. MEB130]